jgi:hypothetical protein
MGGKLDDAVNHENPVAETPPESGGVDSISPQNPIAKKNGRIKIPGGRGACRTPKWLLPERWTVRKLLDLFDLLIVDFDLRVTGVEGSLNTRETLKGGQV